MGITPPEMGFTLIDLWIILLAPSTVLLIVLAVLVARKNKRQTDITWPGESGPHGTRKTTSPGREILTEWDQVRARPEDRKRWYDSPGHEHEHYR